MSGEKSFGFFNQYIVIDRHTGLRVPDAFVLRPSHDKAARKALETYSKVTPHQGLADNINIWLTRLRRKWDDRIK